MCEIEFERLVEQLRNLKTEDFYRVIATVKQPKEQQKSFEQTEPFLTAQEAADFLKLKKNTIYQLKDKYPFHKNDGRLLFLKSELQAYILNGKQKPVKDALKVTKLPPVAIVTKK